MSNPDEQYFTIDGEEYNNWYYNLSDMIAAIIARLPSTTTVNSIASDLTDINDRLSMAFPEDQADMNDSIANLVLDDSDDKGITVSKITSTKSTLDEGVDAFEVDSSGITWSNPFEALFHLDWAWFSTETAANLQAPDEASLMNDIDYDIDYSGLQYYNYVNSYYDDGY